MSIIRISKEYQEFLEKEFKKRRYSIYETLCNLSEKILPIPVWKEKREKLQEAIDFCFMRITPKGAFSFSIISSLIVLIILLTSPFILNIKPPLVYWVLVFVVTISVFAYFYNYPTRLATYYRIKANSEMILAIVYLTVSLRTKPNLENALLFTSTNLTGPLATELKELLWGLYTGKYISVEAALDDFSKKWKGENREFAEAINLIKTTFFEGYREMDLVLDEAVSVVLRGSKERLKHYVQDLKTPLMILNALGILLPIIGLMFFPMIAVFMPETIKPITLIIGYDILLPLIVYWLIRNSLMKRPYTFHQPDISKHPKYRRSLFGGIEIFLPILITIVPVGIGMYQILYSESTFSFSLLVFSVMIICGISLGIISYCFLSSFNKLGLRGEIVQMESELGVAMFQLGYQLRGGMPIENAIKHMIPKIRDMKISNLFGKTVQNMEMFGATFERAMLDKQIGAIIFYPSILMRAIMKATVDISKSGMAVLSKSVISISNYLKDMHDVEEYFQEILSEVTSTMRMQALLLAPLTAGIVVGLTAMMMMMLTTLRGWVDQFQAQLQSYGPIGMVGGGIFDSFIKLNEMMPISHFQLIVGIYMIEVVTMLTIFLGVIEYGEENILRKFNLAKMLFIGTIIYSISLLLVYSLLSSLTPMMMV